VDVVDDSTIKINLKAAPAGLLATFSTSNRAWMVSKVAVEKNGDDWLARNDAGSGPFTFVEWRTGDGMTFKKFDKHWEKGEDGQPLPYLDGINYLFRQDKTVKVLGIRGGSIDIIDEIDGKDIPGLKSTPDLDVIEYDWASQLQYFFFNLKKEPWSKNLKLRQAALYALDRENVAKAGGKGFGYPAYYWWGKGMMAYDETLPKYDFQPQKAKQLLQEAGFPNGLDLKLTLIAREPDQSTAVVMKQMWDQVGLRTTVDPIERNAVIALWQTAAHEIGASGRGWGVVDPDQFSYRIVTGGNFNFSHSENLDLDNCMKEGRESFDDKKREEIYKKCQKILFEAAMFDQTWYQPKTVVVNKKVKNWKPFFGENFVSRYIWLDR
jgi:peptide/nickel transport system substrate-binding protein